MKPEFVNPPISYKPEGEVETPYLRAKEEWDKRIGSVVVRGKNWRVAFFLLGTLSLLLALANLYQLTQRKLVPMVITVDEKTGRPTVFGKVAEANYLPREAEIRYFLGHFINLVRSVPGDPVLIKKHWLSAYKFLRREAANYLNDITNTDERSPLKRIGEVTVSVEPISALKVDGSSSYQLRWKETVYNQHGTLLEAYTMSGLFTIVIEPGADEKTLSVNPLGLYITNFQWSREL